MAMDEETLIAVLGVMTLICGIAAFGPQLFAGPGQKRIQRRLERVAGQEAAANRPAATITVRRDVTDSSIAALDRLIKRLLPRPAVLRERLALTGRRIPLAEYLLVCMLAGALMFFILTSLVKLPAAAAILFGAATALFLPHKVIGIMVSKRRMKFISVFPEAIELMVRGLKSGIPVSESIKVVGQEVPDPVGVEFRSITDAMALGQTFDEALSAASARLALPEFRFFVISLGIQQETGGNLSETLDNLAIILRKRKQMKLKIRALSSEARASAYILGSLPFLVFGALTLMSPDYTRVLFDDPRGHIVLGAALTSLATGVGIMIKMGKFAI
jgi:tight adherence protein B